MDDAFKIEQLIESAWFYASIIFSGLVVFLIYIRYHNKKIKPHPLKIAEKICEQWVHQKYGKHKGYFENFIDDFRQFEEQMEFKFKYSDNYQLRTLSQFISHRNKLNDADFLERVSIFFEKPMLVQGSIASNGLK